MVVAAAAHHEGVVAEVAVAEAGTKAEAVVALDCTRVHTRAECQSRQEHRVTVAVAGAEAERCRGSTLGLWAVTRLDRLALCHPGGSPTGGQSRDCHVEADSRRPASCDRRGSREAEAEAADHGTP